MTTKKDDATEALTPGTTGAEAAEQETRESAGGDDPESPLPDEVEWAMPDDSDEDGEGRTGFLSTYTEVHAFVMGVTAGSHFALSGDEQLLNDLVGLAATGDRARLAKQLPSKHREQALEELPTFIFGAALGFGLSKTDMLAEMGVGV